MKLLPNRPGGYAIFCDDVRQEVSGKISVIGMYTGEMTAYGATPLSVATFCVLIVYREEPPKEPKTIELKILKEGTSSEVIFSGEVEIPALTSELDLAPAQENDAQHFLEVMTVARFSPLVLTEPCKIRVRAYADDHEIRLGTLNVKIGAIEDYPVALGHKVEKTSK